MMYRLLSFLSAFIFIVALFTAPAQAAEKILRYHSDISVTADAQVIVRELIRVQAQGREIKRGIYRDFPTTYNKEDGTKLRVGFEVLAVTKNGQKEPFHIKNEGHYKRVYIGDKETYIPSGTYTYEILYSVNRMVRFEEDFDEIYWNVTGNFWSFPIEQASATVLLPINAQVLQYDAYTGPLGATEKNFTAKVTDNQDAVTFSTTQALPRKHGLTVAVGWPKGYVVPPTEWDELKYVFYDNSTLWSMLLFFIALNIYYYLLWRKYGRDPEGGTIIPQFTPPDNFSPAMVAYVAERGIDGKTGREAFSAALVNLAVKGYIRITEEGKWRKKYKIRRSARADIAGLPIGERTILNKMFDGYKDEFLIEKKHSSDFEDVFKGFTKRIESEYKSVYFNRNSKYAKWGIVTSYGFFTLVFESAEVSLPWLVFFMVSVPLVNILYYYLLEAPTMEGQKVLDHIEGFEKYLVVAEKDRLDFLHPPEMTPELFEEFLPYAIALGVENKWAKSFKNALPKEAYEQYQPIWYHGSGHFNCKDMSSSLGRSLSSTVSTASSVPGSSGGGSSGGGGGGGGGGGW